MNFYSFFFVSLELDAINSTNERIYELFKFINGHQWYVIQEDMVMTVFILWVAGCCCCTLKITLPTLKKSCPYTENGDNTWWRAPFPLKNNVDAVAVKNGSPLKRRITIMVLFGCLLRYHEHRIGPPAIFGTYRPHLATVRFWRLSASFGDLGHLWRPPATSGRWYRSPIFNSHM